MLLPGHSGNKARTHSQVPDSGWDPPPTQSYIKGQGTALVEEAGCLLPFAQAGSELLGTDEILQGPVYVHVYAETPLIL